MARTSVLNLLTRRPTASHYDSGTMATMGRPRDVFMGAPQHDYDQLHVIPRFPLAYITMFQGMYMSLPWRFAVQTKIMEKSRRGMVVKPRFSAKCVKCDKEYQALSPEDRCIVPGCKGKLIGPDQDEYDYAVDLMKNMNLNGQSLTDLMEMCAEDICVADEGYLIFRKEYIYDKEGNIKYQKVIETAWGSSIVMRPVVDLHTGIPGGLWYVCPGEHRNDLDVLVEREKNPNSNPQVPTGSRYETPFDAPKCKKCGMVMQDVEYVSLFHERGQPEQFYIRGEVCHWHEYKKSNTITVPPGLTLWVSSSIITYKDTYIRDSYMKQRKPRGALVVSTSNPEDFMNMWDTIMEKTKKDWHYMPVIPFEPEPGLGGQGANRIAWVDFMGTMLDLDYKEIREIYERHLYMWYGISNIFANLETGAGGKGGTEARLIVENRHIERSNNCDNANPLMRVSLEYGLKDHVYEWVPVEDRDIMKRLQIETHQINNAQMRFNLGYEADMTADGKEFIYRKDPEREIQKAINMITSLLSLKSGQPAGGQPPMGQPSVPSAKPKVSSSEFTGTGTDQSSSLEKALGDPTMHEGDNKATKPTVNVPNANTFQPSGGYMAPDGTGPYKNKQALGGHMRSRAASMSGGGSSGGGGMDMMGMGGYQKEDLLLTIKELKKLKAVQAEVLDTIKTMVEAMEDVPTDEYGEANMENQEEVPNAPADDGTVRGKDTKASQHQKP